MRSWEPVEMGDLFRIKHGFAFKGEHFTDNGKFLVLTPGNFHESGGFKSRPGKDRYYQAPFPESYILAKGDLIVAMTEQGEGLLGSPAIIPDSNFFLLNQRLGLVSPEKGKSNPIFLFHLFNTEYVRKQIRNTSSGAKVRHTSPERIYRVKVRVPDYPTQKKIAAVLSAYDDLIENNKRRIAILEKMAEEIYREWFVRLRFPGYETTKFEKCVPEGWAITPSNEILDVMGGGTPKTDVPVFWDEGIPFFTPKDAGDGFYTLSTEKTISEKGLRSCNSPLFPVNTIFITARGTVGKLALAHCPMAMNQSCYALRPKGSREVYFYFLSMNNAIAYVKGVSKSGVFDNIIVDTFKTIPWLIPNGNLIDKFNETIRPMFQGIGTLLSANVNLTTQRNLLLPRLISGKLAVEDLDIQFPPNMESSYLEHSTEEQNAETSLLER